MAPIIRQTIPQKKISFWKLLWMIVSVIFIVNLCIYIFSRISPIMGTIGGLLALLGTSMACIVIIYRHLAYYNYKLIEDELIMERVFGRANHLFLTVKLNELEEFKPYHEMDTKHMKEDGVKLYRFVSEKNTNAWYVGEFTRNGDRYRFIIEPNEELLNAIMSYSINE